MPKSLEKTRKHIAKKRNGTIDALHQYSRDSRRMHRASLRDEKLGKQGSLRNKKEQPLLERATYFQDALREAGSVPLELSAVLELIEKYVHQYDEDLEEVQKARRPGRPASTRQDQLENRVKNLLEEQQKGFYVPDMTNETNVLALNRWEGAWSSLSSVPWMRLTPDCTARPASFPPA
ncbi:translation machinery-associated protein 16 [Plectosphaerella cucumerina]|uniref:Translation machinery-associated protein 16 n=1 Tax=Plectosphaerella cucumerina TaxID=40658 RepID=A0A8K0TDI6_9PEZI|nr:translation machinery-associated protein 16 [Plectosphaerella cucumerina]